MAEHPASRDLEAWHAGEHRPDVAAHVSDCTECRARAAELDVARAAFRERADPAALARLVRRSADLRERSARRVWWAALGGAAAAAAAAVLALALVPSDALAPGAAQPPVVERPLAAGRLKSSAPGLAVVVLRDGAQTRHAADAALHLGDRLRVELTVPVPAVLTVGLLADDGAFLVLAEAQQFAAGVHYLATAVEMDGPATAGHVVAGAPADVAAFVRGEVGPVSVLRLEVAP